MSDPLDREAMRQSVKHWARPGSPSAFRYLFRAVDKEFDRLDAENVALRERIDAALAVIDNTTLMDERYGTYVDRKAVYDALTTSPVPEEGAN